MIKLDDNLLTELGLQTLPAEDKKALLRHIYETLEMRVGTTLARQMTDAQLDEFEGFITANDEAGALKWLETNFPNYKDVVSQEFEALKLEVRQAAPQIMASAPQQSPVAAMPEAEIVQPVMQQPVQQLPPVPQAPAYDMTQSMQPQPSMVPPAPVMDMPMQQPAAPAPQYQAPQPVYQAQYQQPQPVMQQPVQQLPPVPQAPAYDMTQSMQPQPSMVPPAPVMDMPMQQPAAPAPQYQAPQPLDPQPTYMATPPSFQQPGVPGGDLPPISPAPQPPYDPTLYSQGL